VHRRVVLTCVLLALVTAVCARADAPHWKVWLCLPGHEPNYCLQNLRATAVFPDGSTYVESIDVPAKPPIDCFYLYPTVSTEKGNNSDLTIQPAEQVVAFLEASPFSQVCRVFAPMYNQVTTNAAHGDYNLEYTDILAAWRDYLANYNDGRGVVLIGHSEGSFLLEKLLAQEYSSFKKLLVSAILLGGDVQVDAQNRFDGTIPACASKTQTGCIVAYSSWDHTPPADAKFESVDNSSDHVLCVDPGAPGGGSSPATPVFPWFATEGIAPQWTAPPATTLWMSYPSLYTARCVRQGQRAWLLVSRVAKAGDTRPTVKEILAPSWGLHAADVNIDLAELVELVQTEAKAYLGGH